MQRCFNHAAAAAMMIASSLWFLPAAQAMAVGDATGLAESDRNDTAPIEKAACWGWGWRGPGVYVSPLGLRAACWDPPLYGGPVYVAPGYAPPAVVVPAAPVYTAPPTYYYCDNPRGYYPTVPSCAGGWRVVAAP